MIKEDKFKKKNGASVLLRDGLMYLVCQFGFFLRYLSAGWLMTLAGVVKAFSGVHPLRLILRRIVVSEIPVISAHSATQCVSPLKVISRLSLLLRDCSFRVAHLQLSGAYPLEEFTLSSVNPLV